MSGDAVDDHIKTAISLLQVANSAMSILSLGSGMSGQMKLLTTGLGLLRSATLLADDGQLASAGKQVTRAVGNMAGRATQIGALLGNTANLVSGAGQSPDGFCPYQHVRRAWQCGRPAGQSGRYSG